MKFFDTSPEYKILKENILERVSKVLNEGNFILGSEVLELERKLERYVGTKHVITCGNGTDALVLALKALGISAGDAVFCPTFTYFASAESIVNAGATPVFVDVDKGTFNICCNDLEKKIKETIKEKKQHPKAIMPVDLFGLPANYPEIRSIAEKHDLKIIEDGAQGFGGEIGSQKACSFGDISTTSFFPTKPLGCYGDGGAVFTDSDEYAEIIRSLRSHGSGKDKYDNVRIGMNSRLDTLQAAILLEKLKYFEIELNNKTMLASNYNDRFGDQYIVPYIPKHYKSSWAQYTLRVEDREKVVKKFISEGIPTMIYYKKCLHLQKAFSYLGYKYGDFPNSEELTKTVLSIPMQGYLHA